MAAYLRTYVTSHDLPVRTGVDVQRVGRDGDGFVADTSGGTVRSRHVVVATGPFHRRHVPGAAAGLDPDVPQVHSYYYRSPAGRTCRPARCWSSVAGTPLRSSPSSWPRRTR